MNDHPTFTHLARSTDARALPLQAGEVAEFRSSWPAWIRVLVIFGLSLVAWGLVGLFLIVLGSVLHGPA